MISEQIKELRNYERIFKGDRIDGNLSPIFGNVANTIEELSEKLKNGGWIPCRERLPEEHDSMFAKFKGTEKWDSAMFEKISDDVNVTVEFENEKRKTKTLHTVDGKWNGGQRGVKFKVIAWQPLPEEYKG